MKVPVKQADDILPLCWWWWCCLVFLCKSIILPTCISDAAPNLRSSVENYDFWNAQEIDNDHNNNRAEELLSSFEHDIDPMMPDVIDSNNNIAANGSFALVGSSARQSRVLHFFPVPVDGECLADDGRRTGTCFNAYECRLKGGISKGGCAMGFGVCCIFIASCNQTITNNITYLVSPNFPSFMPSNVSACNVRVKLLNEDIGQLRIDFYHFSLGQPNRRTGFCDGDVFNITGGPGGSFLLCGQNSGQHIYYDVGGRNFARQQTTLYGSLRPFTFSMLYPNRSKIDVNESEIEILMRFSRRFVPTRYWEIRIAQIPFSQRAPAGCLQYFTSPVGIVQTFNFADNGRHLANQHYRVCMRQEIGMCSIVYQPCDDQSFRIGPNMQFNGEFQEYQTSSALGAAGDINVDGPSSMATIAMQMTTAGSATTAAVAVQSRPTSSSDSAQSSSSSPAPANMQTSGTTQMSSTSSAPRPTTTSASPPASSSAPSPPASSPAPAPAPASSAAPSPDSGPAPSPPASSSAPSPPASSTAPSPPASSNAPSPSSPPPSSSTASPVAVNDGDIDEIDGSGDGDQSSRRPVTSGGFDIFSLFRSAFDFRKQRSAAAESRQFYTTCTDRITMPCIIEDFIGVGLGPLPGCEPVHCGNRFCSTGNAQCRIESTVTPFYMGVHFGNGQGKGSPEDNIGACLRYTQMECL